MRDQAGIACVMKRTITSPDFAADSATEFIAGGTNKRAIQALLWALKPLVELRETVPLSAVTTLLMVALDEGKGVNTYARALGKDRSSMSRCLHDLGDRARNGGLGHGFVSIDPHPTDPQRSQVHLTAKGRSIVQELVKQLRKAAFPRASAKNCRCGITHRTHETIQKFGVDTMKAFTL